MNDALRDGVILITGATGAIGGALARHYATPGRTLILQGRDEVRLEALRADCTARGAQVETRVLDLRAREALLAWLDEVCARAVPDLVVVNAGVNANIGAGGEGETLADIERLVEVNLLGAMAMVNALLPAMRRRGSGQIALVSSLAGYFGLAFTPTYSATKAGLKAWGEALRAWLGPEGIRVNVIMPGYVKSEMCDGMPGPKPFLWPPERAARVIARGLAADRARISFPAPLSWGTWWLAVLPPGVSIRILRWLGYGP